MILELAVNRKRFSKKSTIGELRLSNSDLLTYTLEPPVRSGPDNVLQSAEKVDGSTAIPVGRYEVVLSYSSRFKQIMPLIVGVAFFDGIRFHRGSAPTDTKGCVLTGLMAGQDEVMGSESAYAKLCACICDAIIQGSRVFVTVSGNPPESFWGQPNV